MSLVRLLADPSRVRVSIRKVEDGRYSATVKALDQTSAVVASNLREDPREAVMEALAFAEKAEIPGLDLGLQWAYPHPHSQSDRP